MVTTGPGQAGPVHKPSPVKLDSIGGWGLGVDLTPAEQASLLGCRPCSPRRDLSRAVVQEAAQRGVKAQSLMPNQLLLPNPEEPPEATPGGRVARAVLGCLALAGGTIGFARTRLALGLGAGEVWAPLAPGKEPVTQPAGLRLAGCSAQPLTMEGRADSEVSAVKGKGMLPAAVRVVCASG